MKRTFKMALIASLAVGGSYVLYGSQNKEELEGLAVKLVKDELGIPDGAMQFDAELVMQPMGAAEGMKSEPEMPSEKKLKN